MEDSVILKYEQTLSVCFVRRVWEGVGELEGGVSASQSVCVCEQRGAGGEGMGQGDEGRYRFSLWLEKPYLQKHRKKGLLAEWLASALS